MVHVRSLIRFALPVLLVLLLVACGGGESEEPHVPSSSGGTVSGEVTDSADATDTSDTQTDAFTTDELTDPPPERSDVGEPLPERLLTAEEMRELVDPWIGSGGLGFGYASLTPAAQWPNGLVKVGPDTTDGGLHMPQQHFSGYHHDDPDIRGFSHLRMVGTGAADLGILRLLPLAELPFRDGEVWTPKDRESEWAHPGSFGVRLPEAGVDVELIAGHDHAWHRYTREGEGELFLLLDPLSSVTDRESEAASVALGDDGAVVGHLYFRGGFTGRGRGFDVWYSAEILPAPTGLRVHDGEAWVDEPTRSAEDRRVVFTWDAPPEEVTVRLALSLVGPDEAEARLEAVRNLSPEDMRTEAEAAWDEVFERYRFAGRHRGDGIKLATAIYNLYRMPTIHARDGEQYRGIDGEVHVAEGFTYLTDLSLWDSFRTLHPVLELADPELARATVQSLMAMYRVSGAVPRWPSFLTDTGSMLGSPGANVFAGAILKGIVDDLDHDALLDALHATDYGLLHGGERGRPDLDVLMTLGYYPDDINESVSKTLEYAWADDAMARIAEYIGAEDRVPEAMEGRSRWQHVFDDETRFFQPRGADGEFNRVNRTSTVYMRSGPFTEGNAWHWRFYPLWDLDAFADRFGREEMGAALEQFFSRSDVGRRDRVDTMFPDTLYWHGNEPPLSAVWMFVASDRPERGPYWVARILDRAYGVGPDGIPGNDDGGTLSAWLVAAMWGLYPVAGTDLYHIGPLHVDEVVLPDAWHGETRLVRDPALGREDLACIRDEDGQTYRDTIRHADLRGTLTFLPLEACEGP